MPPILAWSIVRSGVAIQERMLDPMHLKQQRRPKVPLFCLSSYQFLAARLRWFSSRIFLRRRIDWSR